MKIIIGWCIVALAASSPVMAGMFDLPPGFRIQDIAANGTTLHVRVGGQGPAVVLLHGYGETGDMWLPMARELARDHTVIVPDLRGMGLSAVATSGFDKKNQAHDVAGVLDALHVGRIELVTHDIGNMVGFAFAAQFPERVVRFVLIDAPVPGVGPWEQILKNPLLWHFRFGGPDMERLVMGRERIYLDRFWNEFSADPQHFPELARAHYARLYARPGNMHAGFLQFAAFDQDALDNQGFLAGKGKLRMPVLALGGEKSFGLEMADVMRFAADDVQGDVVPGAGHWIMEENPVATIALVRSFLDQQRQAMRLRLTPGEISGLARGGAGPGTSGVQGIQTTVLEGDPTQAGPYVIALRVPAHTRIKAHTHQDERSAVVVEGAWYFAYGAHADDALVKELPAGSFYTEPAGQPHFAQTRDSAALVYITGFGPTDTRYVEDAGDK
jgi:pimeloyl-ACP methyl ester carboxylesterase/quercetin dioxygenase-like cupin family protein